MTDSIRIRKNSLILNGTRIATLIKLSRSWVAAPRTELTSVAATTAGTRKAAIAAFVASYQAGQAAAYTAMVATYGGQRVADIVPTECGTCGSAGCRSRFDCTPGAPNDWQ